MHLFATLESDLFSSEYANVDKWEYASYMISKLYIFLCGGIGIITSVFQQKS